jgi:hypothetical protein
MVREAEKRLPSFLCRAVTRAVFLDKRSPKGGNAWTNEVKPDLTNITALGPAHENMLDPQGPNRRFAPGNRAGTIHAIIHEAAHSGIFLLEANNGLEKDYDLAEFFSGHTDWTDEAIAMAKEVVKSNRLLGGFENEWKRVHQSFVNAGLTNDYHGRGDPEMADDQILRMGVMTAYGGDEVSEDIAEMTAGVLSTTAYSHEGVSDLTEDLACRRMQAEAGPGIPDELAAVFTKVGFVQSVGFLDEIDYRECVGNLKVQGEGSGVFSFIGGAETNSYNQSAGGGIGKKDGQGPWIFTFQATGSIGIEGEGTKTARAQLTLEIAPGNKELNKVSFPRGLYKIGPGHGPNNAMYFLHNDGGVEVPAIEIYEADVLVARASHDLIEGSIFVKSFINYTELFKLPQPPKQEHVITFRKVKR